jgi:hypothetical protein
MQRKLRQRVRLRLSTQSFAPGGNKTLSEQDLTARGLY